MVVLKGVGSHVQHMQGTGIGMGKGVQGLLAALVTSCRTL